jgi:hypothetical protein
MRKLLLFLAPLFLLSDSIKHKEPDFFVPKYRVEIIAYVESTETVKESKLFFKKSGDLEFYYVKMKCKRGSCKGVLPAPEINTGSIEYFIETLLNSNRLLTTEVFSVQKYSEPYWIIKREPNSISIFSEDSRRYRDEVGSGNHTALNGFRDKIIINNGTGAYSLSKRDRNRDYYLGRREDSSQFSPLFTP